MIYFFKLLDTLDCLHHRPCTLHLGGRAVVPDQIIIFNDSKSIIWSIGKLANYGHDHNSHALLYTRWWGKKSVALSCKSQTPFPGQNAHNIPLVISSKKIPIKTGHFFAAIVIPIFNCYKTHHSWSFLVWGCSSRRSKWWRLSTWWIQLWNRCWTTEAAAMIRISRSLNHQIIGGW